MLLEYLSIRLLADIVAHMIWYDIALRVTAYAFMKFQFGRFLSSIFLEEKCSSISVVFR